MLKAHGLTYCDIDESMFHVAASCEHAGETFVRLGMLRFRALRHANAVG